MPPQTDPWQEAAKSYKPQQSTAAATPSSGNDDWKVWQQGSQDQPHGNAIQRAFDMLTTVTPEQEKGHSWLTSKAQEFGAGAIQGAGQPFIHPIDTVTGLVSAISHPRDTATGMLKSLKENPAQTLGNIVGGAVTAGGAGEGVSLLKRALPSTARAGETLQSISQAGKDQPVNIFRSGKPLERLSELGTRGGKMPFPAEELLKRSQMIEPITFPEARDFYSNISRLSGEESARMAPTVAREMGSLRKAFHGDLREAADQFGRGQDYESAIREYARAAKLGNALDTAKKWAIPAALGGGVASQLVKKAIQ